MLDLAERLSLLRRQIPQRLKPLPEPYPKFFLVFSVSDGTQRADVVQSSGDSLEAAWQRGVAALRGVMHHKKLKGKWLRVDWVDRVEATTMPELKTLLHRVKRNYFRYGLAFDPAFEVAFLEQELNANAMLYGGNRIPHAIVNEKNILVYARRKYGPEQNIDFAGDREVYILSSQGAFCTENGETNLLNGPGPDAGRRAIDRLSCDDITRLIETSAQFLAQQVGADGAFVYGYHPCFDRTINAYNTLRHASTTYAMIEAWEVLGDNTLRASIERALSYLTNECICTLKNTDGSEAAFVIEAAREIKLGANAVTILALTKYATVTGSTKYHALLEKLALGIRYMQNPENGSFVHVLEYPSLKVKEPFRTIYYEGEAAFGLMRLYDLTGDARWLAMVEKAFDHFIAQNHWKHHDHWLSYCVNELTRHRPEEKYFRFGIQNIADYLDFILKRVTTFPTLLELAMAASDMLMRISKIPRLRHLLTEIDLEKFYKALEYRAHYLLNGYFWPEMAMYFGNPERIVGSFFIRHHAFRVRIDDVEHYLSGLIAYRKYRIAAPPPVTLDQTATNPPLQPHWTASQVAEATGGTWIVPPQEDWSATGLSIYAPAMKPGNLVVVRGSQPESKGVPHSALGQLPFKPAGLIVGPDSNDLDYTGLPLLQVEDTGEATLAMGRYARDRMTGTLFAVTGSAGKTSTVAMLAHALGPEGLVSQTAFNANLPHGVAWNLASMPWEAPHIVLELAIGKMAQSARLAKPHLAIFTNIGPAHLNETSTTIDIARTKSAIFLGMSAGSVAVLNRDMLHWETVQRQARARQLKIIHYGTTADADFQLLDYQWENRTVIAKLPSGRIEYRLGPPGEHMALNSLAILAAAHAAGCSRELVLQRLASMRPLPGRGEEFMVDLDARRIRVIDDAYNANPGSMAAALKQLGFHTDSGRRIAVMGEMAELGPNAQSYHTALAELPLEGIDKFYVMGELYTGFWEKIGPAQRGHFARTLDELQAKILTELRDGDAILFKGSHSTQLHRLVSSLRARVKPTNDKPPMPSQPTLKAAASSSISFPPHLGMIFYDDRAKRIVYSQRTDVQIPPASITKLLTLSLVEDKRNTLGIGSDTLVTVSEKAAKVNSHWGFEAGEKVELLSLMRAAAIVSSNEAAHALAEWHSGTIERFVDLLNKRAATLGLCNTTFTTPSGLGRQQVTTLEDMLTLARYIHACQPVVASMCAEPFFEWKGHRYPSTNRLLTKIKGAEGLKTGSLAGRGNHLIFSAQREDGREIAIVGGAVTKLERDQVVTKMFQYFGRR